MCKCYNLLKDPKSPKYSAEIGLNKLVWQAKEARSAAILENQPICFAYPFGKSGKVWAI